MVMVHGARTGADNQPHRVNITIRPFGEPGGETSGEPEFSLVSFEEIDEALPADASAGETLADGQLVQQLEDEIFQLKKQLQDTIETSDSSAQELKASNEELQAINEELRSASEELETSKEELQSINEELTTVNYELKLKVEETVRINDDLHNLIASTDIAVVFIDAAMRIKRFTPRATNLFNLIASDIGRSLLDITHRLDPESLAGDVEQAFHKLRVIEREVAGEDGRTWLSRVLPYRTIDNKIEGVVLTFVDITSRLKVEKKLKVNEERLRIATETVREYVILTMDDAGVIATWNAGAERAFGYRESEAVGQSFAMLFAPEDRANQLPEAELARALAAGNSSDDRWYVKKDGTRFYCSGETTSFRTGDVTGFAKIARDMTGSKLLEARRDEELSRQTQVRLEAEASNRSKDEFLAVMSHELKHPLNLIHVNAELLARTPEVNHLPAVKRAADTIRRTVAGQARIIDDLLDLSRARTGKMMMTLVAAPLDAIVRRVVDAAQHDAKKKSVTMSHLIAPGVNCTALCDPVRVEQIVWNLLSNAIKFTEPGGEVTVRLTCDGKEASIEVTDNGRGIAPAFLPQVFAMFHQERRGMTNGEGGMGIGLALVKELTEAQGGRVEVRSPGVGEGATFIIRLPLEHSASLPMNANRVEHETLDGLRILAVDDSAEVLEPFAEMMRMDGAHVVEAHSGAEALRALDAEPFDLLISDIGMPQMDGYQLINAVRQRNGVDRIVAIALTGYGRASDAQRASEVGFDAHLSKPTSVDDFKRLVVKLREKGMLQ